MIKILQDNRYVPTPIDLVNKPGGGSSIAYNYVNQQPGNGHYLVLGSCSLITNHIAGLGPSYTELTPVARLFEEYIAVTVKPVSPIRTGNDLVSFMKRDPTALSFGIATSLGAPNHSGVAAPFKAAGIDLKKMKSVIFALGGRRHHGPVGLTRRRGADLGRIRGIPAAQRTGAADCGDLAATPARRTQERANVEGTGHRRGSLPMAHSDQTKGNDDGPDRLLGERDAPHDGGGRLEKELEENFWIANYQTGAESRKFLARDHEDAKAFLTELDLAR